MLTLRYNEPVFILMLRGRVGCLRQPTLPHAGRDVGLAVNVEKTKYRFVFRDQHAGKRHNMKTTFELVEKLKYLETVLTYQIAFMKKLRAN